MKTKIISQSIAGHRDKINRSAGRFSTWAAGSRESQIKLRVFFLFIFKLPTSAGRRRRQSICEFIKKPCANVKLFFFLVQLKHGNSHSSRPSSAASSKKASSTGAVRFRSLPPPGRSPAVLCSSEGRGHGLRRRVVLQDPTVDLLEGLWHRSQREGRWPI